MIGRITVSGFVHGVLNTDNFNVTGECFDYGPWRFVEFAEPNFTAAYFDYNQRYSFGKQPEAALWALTQLGHSLKFFIKEDKRIEILNQFSEFFNKSLSSHFSWRLGVNGMEIINVNKIMHKLLNISQKYKIDFASFFYNFYGGSDSISEGIVGIQGEKYKIDEFKEIINLLKDTESRNSSQEKRIYFKDNYENLLINEVEFIWNKIDKYNDWTFLNNKIAKIRKIGNLLGAKKLIDF